MTVNAYIQPIFDRTPLDITQRTSKAFFNAVDYARINNNQYYLGLLQIVLFSIDISGDNPFDYLSDPSILDRPMPSNLYSPTLLVSACNGCIAYYIGEVVTDIALLPNVGASINYIDVNLWEKTLDDLAFEIYQEFIDISYPLTYLTPEEERRQICGVYSCGSSIL